MPYLTCLVCGALTPVGNSRCHLHRRKAKPKATPYTYQYQRNRALLLKHDDLCWLCGNHGADTADHVIPKSHGGTDDIHNLRPAHKRCNSARGNRTPHAR